MRTLGVLPLRLAVWTAISAIAHRARRITLPVFSSIRTSDPAIPWPIQLDRRPRRECRLAIISLSASDHSQLAQAKSLAACKSRL
jgi:hypothetical protein